LVRPSEVEVVEDGVRGIAVHIGARVASNAQPGEALFGYLAQGDTKNALSLFQEMARQAPKLAAVHQYHGIALARQHNLPEVFLL
jgi:hypothetical protein